MIFVDMDDCLVCFDYYPATIQVRRPGALDLLSGLRAIAPTILFTTGTREHACDTNRDMELGFAPEQIIAQEDFCKIDHWEQKLILHASNPHPRGVLIDNQTPDDSYMVGKMAYLGLAADRVITVNPFWSGEPADRFPSQVPLILRRVQALLSA